MVATDSIGLDTMTHRLGLFPKVSPYDINGLEHTAIMLYLFFRFCGHMVRLRWGPKRPQCDRFDFISGNKWRKTAKKTQIVHLGKIIA